jgi:hypothetical protein
MMETQEPSIWRALNMPCRDRTLLMSRALDQDSPRRTEALITVHTMMCTPCRRLWRQLRFIQKATRLTRADEGQGLLTARMPESVRRRLHDRLASS